jgi:hypothetical protein
MSGQRRSKSQRTRDRRRIAALYLKGWLQTDIAAEVGLSQGTISLDLKVLHKAWLQSSLVDIATAKGREIAKIDALEREYYRAWERSQEDAETITKRASGTKGKERKEGSIITKGQVGNPKFLQGVQWCIDRRIKVMGLDAPARLEVADVSDVRITEVIVEIPAGDIVEGEVVKSLPEGNAL